MNTQVLTPLMPTRTINFAKFQPLFAPANEVSLDARRPSSVRLVTRDERPPAAIEFSPRRNRGEAQLKRIPTEILSVPRGTGTMSRIGGVANLNLTGSADIHLPTGMPRFVNAATLKRMLGAEPSELLLKKSGERFDVCDDSTKIDLTDESVEFRLGAIQIFS